MLVMLIAVWLAGPQAKAPLTGTPPYTAEWAVLCYLEDVATKKQTLDKLTAAEASVRQVNKVGALTNIAAAKRMVATLREPASPTQPESFIVPPERIYSVFSPFNAPISNPVAHPESDAMVAALVDSKFSGRCTFYAGVAGRPTEIGDYYHPLYRARSTDPLYSIQFLEDWGDKSLAGAKVRIPEGAQPTVSDDGHLAIFDGEWEYDFWQVKSIDHGRRVITSSWGGRLPSGGTGTGGGGSTAASFGLAAGQIRVAELEAGRIDHALFLAIPKAPGVVLPAVHAKGWPAPAPPLPPLGTHFYLDMTVAAIASLPEPPWKKTVLTALNKFGGFVGDQTGGTITGPESSQPWRSAGLPDPLVEFAKAEGIAPDSNGIYAFKFGAAVDWRQHLKVAAP